MKGGTALLYPYILEDTMCALGLRKEPDGQEHGGFVTVLNWAQPSTPAEHAALVGPSCRTWNWAVASHLGEGISITVGLSSRPGTVCLNASYRAKSTGADEYLCLAVAVSRVYRNPVTADVDLQITEPFAGTGLLWYLRIPRVQKGGSATSPVLVGVGVRRGQAADVVLRPLKSPQSLSIVLRYLALNRAPTYSEDWCTWQEGISDSDEKDSLGELHQLLLDFDELVKESVCVFSVRQ